MFNKMSKMEIAGLAVAGLGTIAGIGIAVYTKIKTGKEVKEMEHVEEIIEETKEILDELLNEAETIED